MFIHFVWLMHIYFTSLYIIVTCYLLSCYINLENWVLLIIKPHPQSLEINPQSTVVLTSTRLSPTLRQLGVCKQRTKIFEAEINGLVPCSLKAWHVDTGPCAHMMNANEKTIAVAWSNIHSLVSANIDSILYKDSPACRLWEPREFCGNRRLMHY